MASPDLLSPIAIWLGAGLALMVAEAVLPGAFLVWLGIAALGTGLLELAFGLGFELQVISFAALACIAVGCGLALRRKVKPNELNMPGSGLVGRPAMTLGFVGRQGRVRLGDSDWEARLIPDAPEVKPGAMLRVVGLDGTVLVVRPD